MEKYINDLEKQMGKYLQLNKFELLE